MTTPAPALPHGLAEPLHLLVPWWQRPWVLFFLALGLLLLVLWLRRRRRAAPGPVRAPPSKPHPAVGGGRGVAGAIRGLRNRYGPDADLRPGLHELALLLRGHFLALLPAAERAPGRTSLTLARHLGDVPAAGLLRRVVRLQFGRVEPTWEEFTEVVDQALETVTGSGGGRGRGREAR